jgi:hypothetical protein
MPVNLGTRAPAPYSSGLRPRAALWGLSTHQPLHGAARDRDPFMVQLGVDLPGALDTQVRLVRDLDVGDQLGIAQRPRGRRPGLRRVAARGELHTGLLQHGADRLDPDLAPIEHIVAMSADVGHYLLMGR